MCPACIITIGGGLLLAKNIGIDNLLFIGLVSILFSLLTDTLLRKTNNGKVFFPYQRVIMSVVTLFITILLAQFLL